MERTGSNPSDGALTKEEAWAVYSLRYGPDAITLPGDEEEMVFLRLLATRAGMHPAHLIEYMIRQRRRETRVIGEERSIHPARWDQAYPDPREAYEEWTKAARKPQTY